MAGYGNLWINQVGVLVHELAHLYGAFFWEEMSCTDRMDPDSMFYAEEEYRLQQCAELPADKQLLSAQNYAFYAACRVQTCLPSSLYC